MSNNKDLNITKKFKKYKIRKSIVKMEDFCYPKKYTLQPQQDFLPNLLNSSLSPWNTNPDIRGILVFHQIGAGKTCSAIRIAEEFKNKLKIVVVLPASLVGNFISELRSECTNDTYITENERNRLKKYKPEHDNFKTIIERSNERIKKVYKIYSYHKFIALIKEKKIEKLNNTLLIIDEVQNMISMDGIFYKSLNKVINNSNDSLKLVLLSATPMFDKPIEIGLTINLLKRDNLISINDFNNTYLDIIKTKSGIDYNINNIKDFREKIHNLVSYYRGAPPQAYPKMEFKVVKCNMNDFQYKSYLSSLSSEDKFIKGSFKSVDLLNLPQNFFIGSRFLSNVAFPNKSTGLAGLSSFSGEALEMQNISNYSIKFYKIMKKINECEGTIFIYSNFKELGGIGSLVKFLEYHNWVNYKNFGEGEKRFAIWSGDEKHSYKEEMKYVFNQKSNEDGSKIKIVLGSPSIKEGVSLLRVRQVHILEPYWNMSRMLQIMGRAVRFCSHKDLPRGKRNVEVYLYLATYPKQNTIDQYIWSLAQKKNKLIEQFEMALKETAIDCKLFYNRNYYPKDEVKLICRN